jgi:DNA-binding NarL/FixJ family response regulator
MDNKKQHTILLADDHSILRAGLRSILESQSNLKVITEVSNGLDALKSAISLKPDLLITDISMPKKNGTDTIFELKKRQPETKAIVLTMHASEKHIHAALNAGADGYILKDDSHKELLAAIENVLNGKTHLSPSICGNIVNGYLNNSGESKPVTKSEMLTRREREVIKLIAEGFRNKDIAEQLSISIKTVEKHRSNLMKKLDLHSISNLTNYAIQNGLVHSS